jgi:hypothetical protein
MDNNHRETKLLGEPANVLRLNYITELIDTLNLPEKSRILDFGGNNFKNYCKTNNFIYQTLDLKKPQKMELEDILVVD